MENIENKNGTIYKIISITEDFDPKHTYYGSTFGDYNERFKQHKRAYNCYKNGLINKKYSSFDLFNIYGIENCRVIPVETHYNICKDKLNSLETHFIYNNLCINKSKKLGIIYNSKEEYKKIYASAVFNCEICGENYTRNHKKRHEQSYKHKYYLIKNSCDIWHDINKSWSDNESSCFSDELN